MYSISYTPKILNMSPEAIKGLEDVWCPSWNGPFFGGEDSCRSRATTAAAGAAPGAPAAPGDAARKPGAGAGAPASPDGDADGLGISCAWYMEYYWWFRNPYPNQLGYKTL